MRKAPRDVARLCWFALRGHGRWITKAWTWATHGDLRADARTARLAGDPQARRAAQEMIQADARARWTQLGVAVRRVALGAVLLGVLAGMLAIINAAILAGQLLDALFPGEGQADPWEAIKGRVEELINAKIDDAVWNQAKSGLQGVRNNFWDYYNVAKTITPESSGNALTEVRKRWGNAHSSVIGAYPRFQTDTFRALLLPLFVQVANFYIALLYRKYWEAMTYDRESWISTVETAVQIWPYMKITDTNVDIPQLHEVYLGPIGTTGNPRWYRPYKTPNEPLSAVWVWSWDRVDAIQCRFGEK